VVLAPPEVAPRVVVTHSGASVDYYDMSSAHIVQDSHPLEIDPPLKDGAIFFYTG